MANDREDFFFRNEKLQTPQTGLGPIPALHNNHKPLIMLTATTVGW
jgi:hypothetical protein